MIRNPIEPSSCRSHNNYENIIAVEYPPPCIRCASLRRIVTRTGSIVLLWSLLFLSGTAFAQQLDNYLPSNLTGYDVMPGVTVTSRERPEYAPLAIHLGSTQVSLGLRQALGFDDNVLGTNKGRSSP